MKRIMTVILVLISLLALAQAEPEQEIWVLCEPKSYVNIRSGPSGRSGEEGRAYCADGFLTDGKTKDGFIHVYCSTEAGEGWISLRYVVWEQPVPVYEEREIDADGKVRSRKTVGGDRRCWLKPGQTVYVYWMSEWAITDRGYVWWEFIGE